MLGSRATPLLSGLAVLALGCQPAGPDPYIEPSCDEVVTELGSFDAPAPSGSTAGEFVAAITGPRVLTLEYLGPPPDMQSVFVDIDHGDADTTELTLELTLDESTLRFVESELVDPEGEGTLVCDDRFELAGTLGFSTADGVFAELFEAEVVVTVDESGAPRLAAVPIAFDPEALAGSFEVLSIEPSAPEPSGVFHELWVEFPIADGSAAPRGYVGGVAEYDFIDFLAVGVFHVAVFGGYDLDA